MYFFLLESMNGWYFDQIKAVKVINSSSMRDQVTPERKKKKIRQQTLPNSEFEKSIKALQ